MGIARQLSPSDLPANGPLATRESRAVSHASPMGSCKLNFSGNNGARQLVPQGRGLKNGSMRVRTGSVTSGRSFSARKEFMETSQTFFDPFDRSGIGNPQEARSAESLARY